MVNRNIEIMRRSIEQGAASGLSDAQLAGMQRGVDKWDAEQAARDLKAAKRAEAQLTAEQKAETQRQIEAHKQSVNFGGTGLNGDIANLGLSGIQTTNDFSDVSAAGGGQGRVASPRRTASPANTGQYSPTVRTTPGVVVPSSRGLNGDIVDLGFNASATGIEPIGMGGQGYYQGGGASGRSISKPVTADTSMLGGEFIPPSESFSVGGPQPLGPSAQELAINPGAYGGLVTRDEGGRGYTDSFVRMGVPSQPPAMDPRSIGQRQSQELKDFRAEEQAARDARLRLLSEEGDDPFGFTGFNPPASESPRAEGIRERIGRGLPPTGSWANVPGAGAGAYMSGVSDRLVTPGEVGTQQREALEAIRDEGDIPGPVNILNPRSVGQRQVWEFEQEKKGFLNSGFY